MKTQHNFKLWEVDVCKTTEIGTISDVLYLQEVATIALLILFMVLGRKVNELH